MSDPYYSGMRVLLDDQTTFRNEYKQFRFPKSRKSRIRKKWRRDQTNFKVVKSHVAYVLNKSGIVREKTLVISTRAWEQLINEKKLLIIELFSRLSRISCYTQNRQ